MASPASTSPARPFVAVPPPRDLLLSRGGGRPTPGTTSRNGAISSSPIRRSRPATMTPSRASYLSPAAASVRGQATPSPAQQLPVMSSRAGARHFSPVRPRSRDSTASRRPRSMGGSGSLASLAAEGSPDASPSPNTAARRRARGRLKAAAGIVRMSIGFASAAQQAKEAVSKKLDEEFGAMAATSFTVQATTTAAARREQQEELTQKFAGLCANLEAEVDNKQFLGNEPITLSTISRELKQSVWEHLAPVLRVPVPSANVIETMCDQMTIQLVEPGSHLHFEHEPAKWLWVVLSGNVCEWEHRDNGPALLSSSKMECITGIRRCLHKLTLQQSKLAKATKYYTQQAADNRSAQTEKAALTTATQASSLDGALQRITTFAKQASSAARKTTLALNIAELSERAKTLAARCRSVALATSQVLRALHTVTVEPSSQGHYELYMGCVHDVRQLERALQAFAEQLYSKTLGWKVGEKLPGDVLGDVAFWLPEPRHPSAAVVSGNHAAKILGIHADVYKVFIKPSHSSNDVIVRATRLSTIHWLRPVPQAARVRLAAAATWHHAAFGSILVDAGQPLTHVYIIFEGTVQIAMSTHMATINQQTTAAQQHAQQAAHTAAAAAAAAEEDSVVVKHSSVKALAKQHRQHQISAKGKEPQDALSSPRQLLQAPSARLYGRMVDVAVLGHGTVVGLADALMQNTSASISATAVGDVTAMKIPLADLFDLLPAFPTISAQLSATATSQYRKWVTAALHAGVLVPKAPTAAATRERLEGQHLSAAGDRTQRLAQFKPNIALLHNDSEADAGKSKPRGRRKAGPQSAVTPSNIDEKIDALRQAHSPRRRTQLHAKSPRPSALASQSQHHKPPPPRHLAGIQSRYLQLPQLAQASAAPTSRASQRQRDAMFMTTLQDSDPELRFLDEWSRENHRLRARYCRKQYATTMKAGMITCRSTQLLGRMVVGGTPLQLALAKEVPAPIVTDPDRTPVPANNNNNSSSNEARHRSSSYGFGGTGSPRMYPTKSGKGWRQLNHAVSLRKRFPNQLIM